MEYSAYKNAHSFMSHKLWLVQQDENLSEVISDYTHMHLLAGQLRKGQVHIILQYSEKLL